MTSTGAAMNIKTPPMPIPQEVWPPEMTRGDAVRALVARDAQWLEMVRPLLKQAQAAVDVMRVEGLTHPAEMLEYTLSQIKGE